MSLLRTALTLFAGLLLYGALYFFAIDHAIPQWLVNITLLVTGMGFQILYARLVNKHLDALGLSGAEAR
jgi:hypothetical protein